jgi:hypothetical protein
MALAEKGVIAGKHYDLETPKTNPSVASPAVGTVASADTTADEADGGIHL